MLKTIIYREFLSNIITYRFLLGLLICVGLVGANTYVLMRGYEDGLQSSEYAWFRCKHATRGPITTRISTAEKNYEAGVEEKR